MKTLAPFKIAIIVLSISIAWIAFEHLMGYNTTRHDIGQFARLLPPVLFWISLFIAVWNEKRKNSKLTFTEGWKAGILCSLVYSFGFTLVIIVYQQLINPEFYETLKAFSLAKLQSHQATPAQIDSAMKELEMSYNGTSTSYVQLFLFSFIWGVILSSLAALIFKSKKEPSATATNLN